MTNLTKYKMETVVNYNAGEQARKRMAYKAAVRIRAFSSKIHIYCRVKKKRNKEEPNNGV